MSDDTNSGGGQTLGGGSGEPLPAGWGTSRPQLGRVSDLANAGAGAGPARGAHGDSEGEEEEEEGEQGGENWFAGGERSGINVQNPDRVPGGHLVRDLLRKAAQGGPAPNEPKASAGAFRGGGHKLGSDEVESSYVPDPTAPPPNEEGERAVRHITFWRNGFSIEDGPLLGYDDPANTEVLNDIKQGRAPPEVLNVRVGQPVELRVARRINDEYQPPQRAAGQAFRGSGNRLGSPVPTVLSGGTAAPRMPGSFPAGTSRDQSPHAGPSVAAPTANITPSHFEVDHTKPTTSIQLRLMDGTKIVCRMNLTHTVQDIRNFINASSPEYKNRPYTIGTTFPSRILDDGRVTIAEANLANSVVVQRLV